MVFGCHVAAYTAETRLLDGLGGLWMSWYGLSSLNLIVGWAWWVLDVMVRLIQLQCQNVRDVARVD